MSARILTCTEAEYFADPCAVPSLSQSIANVLVKECPLLAWHEHPRLGGAARKPSKDMDNGTILHSLMLGKGSSVEIIHADNYRTKAAQAQRDEATEAGRVPMLAKQYAGIQSAAEAMRESLEAFDIRLTGDSEVKVEWTEKGTYGEVLCRGMFDHLIIDRGVIYDVKKIRSANPKTCAKHMLEYGYDVQHTAYTSALGKLRPDLEGRIDMVFLFMEIEPPYLILPARPDGTMREIGSMKWNRAVNVWERCLLNNQWPGYCDSVVSLSAPAWAITEEMGTDANW